MCNELNLNGDASLDPIAPHARRFDASDTHSSIDEPTVSHIAPAPKTAMPKSRLVFDDVPHGSLIFLITVIKETSFDARE